jgi:protein TonB
MAEEPERSAPAAQRETNPPATVSFTIDRSGHVLTSRLEQCRVPALEQATPATVPRAAPLPAPPAGVPGAQFSFSLPIRYDVR